MGACSACRAAPDGASERERHDPGDDRLPTARYRPHSPLHSLFSALYGAWPICLIVFAAVFLFDLCTVTGHFEVVKCVARPAPLSG